MSQDEVNLTPQEDRNASLLAAGVPEALLKLIASVDERDENFGMTDEEGAYFYLTTEPFDELDGYQVTPICTTVTDEEFYLLLQRGDEQRWVYFSLEGGIRAELDSVDQLLGSFLAEEIEALMEDGHLDSVAAEIGFAHADKLRKAWDEDDKETLGRLAGPYWGN